MFNTNVSAKLSAALGAVILSIAFVGAAVGPVQANDVLAALASTPAASDQALVA